MLQRMALLVESVALSTHLLQFSAELRMHFSGVHLLGHDLSRRLHRRIALRMVLTSYQRRVQYNHSTQRCRHGGRTPA